MHIFTICTSRYGRFSSQSLLPLDGFSSLAFIRYVVRGGTFENDNRTCRQYSFSFQWLDAVVLLLPPLSMMLFSLLFSCSPFSYTFSSTFCVKRSFFFSCGICECVCFVFCYLWECQSRFQRFPLHSAAYNWTISTFIYIRRVLHTYTHAAFAIRKL